ncbi:MAG: serine/threonine protein kinase [Verrucomicrobia bacterium]|nr:serine/threonine protein kinase [Verrucomicrobiota bacterium]
MAEPTSKPGGPASSGAVHLLRLIELGKPLGRGLMGSVYPARVRPPEGAPVTGLPAEVAVRVLSSRFYGEAAFMSRFYADAVAARRLQHPNLVRVLDVAELSGRHCLAMELVHGLSLDKWVEKRGKLHEPKLAQIAVAVAEALKAALDQERLLHRAIRPQNIFVDHNGGNVRVGDIGLARAAMDGHGKPIPDRPVGDSHYTAPELTQGEKQGDCRGDIYALGATLYHLATGVKPFGEHHGDAALAAQREGRLKAPREFAPSLSDSFCQVLAKMLARKPADRYASYEPLIADLRALSEGGRPRAAAIEPGQTVLNLSKAASAAQKPSTAARSAIKAPERRGPAAVTATPAAEASVAAQPARKVHHHPSWMTTRMVIAAWLLVPVLIVACLIAWLYRDIRYVDLQYEQMMEEIGDNWSKSPNPSKEELASRLFAQASAYVRTNPSHTQGIVARYAAVAKRFPDTQAGISAAKEAERWRERR